ncbi:MAG TPA: hypothetical protein VLC53_02320 [Myxococcota bacterium]|nr:hypothetical protein [Myxococcota bacterium]
MFSATYTYVEGLRYTLVLNALGIGFLVRAWTCDLWLFGGATYIPRWLSVSIGVLLQVPGFAYLMIGAWAMCSPPGGPC